MKGKTSLRWSDEQKEVLTDGFKRLAENNEEKEWEEKWDWRRHNKSLTAFILNQAIRQTKADLANLDILQNKARKSKGASHGKAKKGSRRKR